MTPPVRKRTKIIATLGPASGEAATIGALIDAGVDVFRINFSHGSAATQRRLCALVRDEAARRGAQVAVLGDLQGPKIRIGRIAGAGMSLEAGQSLVIDPSLGEAPAEGDRVGTSYPDLARDLRPGQRLLLDDGRIELAVEEIAGDQVRTRVVTGGLLGSGKGINLRGGGLSAPALTAKDLADLALAAELDLDYLAVSFPRSGDDVRRARTLAREAGCEARIVAKVERAEAVADDGVLDDLIEAADAVMVARGDLGVEIGDAELIGVQKKIIRRARERNRLVITATQMMETMVEHPLPTRAEVFDVANAVLDGTDAVMLSAETAVGRHPVRVVEAMVRIILGAERHAGSRPDPRLARIFHRTDEAIAMAAIYTATHLEATAAILCLTESGSTPLWMSRVRSGIPIYGISRHPKALRAMALYRGVIPMPQPATAATDPAEILRLAMEELKERGELAAGDQVLCTFGTVFGRRGETNTLKILRVE
ncbi:MAG: pyruvate kinase [Porticoccaceae bacterium]|nr:MAG: pyruvate kinase [Porticoccaceae bacterium]